MEAQLAELDRAPQLVLGLELAHGLRGHRGLEQLHAAPELLGSVHRQIGFADQVPCTGLARPGAGDPDARPDLQLVAMYEERLGDRGPRAFGDTERLALPAQVLAQDHELVPSVADHGVARPQGPLQAPRHLDQQVVAGVVAEAVVDALEPVKIEEQERQRSRSPARAPDRHVEAIEQQDAVREAGERIVQRLVGEAGGGPLALDRVADRAVERIRVGCRADHIVLGSLVNRAEGDRPSARVRDDDDRDLRGARQDRLECLDRFGVSGGEVEHEAVDRVLAERAAGAWERVSGEHVTLPADSRAQLLGERLGVPGGRADDEQP